MLSPKRRICPVCLILLCGCVPQVNVDDLPEVKDKIAGRTTVYIPASLSDRVITYRDVFEFDLEFGDLLVDATTKAFAKYFEDVELVFAKSKYEKIRDDSDYVFSVDAYGGVFIEDFAGAIHYETIEDAFTASLAVKVIKARNVNRFPPDEDKSLTTFSSTRTIEAFSPDQAAMARSAIYACYQDIMRQLLQYLERKSAS